MAKGRRDNGSGSTSQRPNGTWMGQVDLGIVDGKRKRVTVYGRTERIVQNKLKALIRQLDEHGDLPTSEITVEKWLTYWLDNVAANRTKPNTWRSYRTAVNKHIIPAIGNKKLSRLSVEDVETTLRDYIVITKGLSSTTAHNAHRVLSVALNEAVKRGRVPRNIAGITDAPSKEASTRVGLTAEQAIAVIRKAREDERLGSRWLAAFLFGARQGECLGLRWQHLDLELGRADIAWSLQRVPWRHGCLDPKGDPTCGYKQAARCEKRQLAIRRGLAHHVLSGNLVLLPPKTKSSIRSIAIYEPLRIALLERRAQVEQERPGYTVDHDLVWCRPDGSPIDPRDDWEAWSALLSTAGVGHVTGHETRHTAATMMLEAGVDTSVAKEILGHSEILVTQGYQHVSLALQRGALEKVGQRLELD